MSKARPKRQRKPLGITCKSTNCKANLHCFLPAPQNRKPSKALAGSTSAGETANESTSATEYQEAGRCWECGADLVDWTRVHKRDFADVGYTFQCLKYELFRHYYWHIAIDQTAENHARRKGLIGMREATEKRIRKYVGKGIQPDELTFDGRQTPLEGNAIYYAQHATATCCRKCMEVWHKIPREQDLTDEQVSYFVDIIMLYIKDRLPHLTEHGEKVAPIRQKPSNADAGE